MPDILLIQPPIQDFYLTAKRTLPYGLAGIAANLRQEGFSVEILDALATSKNRVIAWPGEMAYLEPFFGRSDRSPFGLFHTFRHFGYSFEHIANQTRRSGAFLIGISSLFSAYSAVALETAAIVKQACPHAFIVLGGHHPTALPEQVIQHPAVDFVLRGDGELGLPLLAKALRQALPLDGIPRAGSALRRRHCFHSASGRSGQPGSVAAAGAGFNPLVLLSTCRAGQLFIERWPRMPDEVQLLFCQCRFLSWFSTPQRKAYCRRARVGGRTPSDRICRFRG